MSDPVLYHGTRRGFQRGGLLLPRAVHGGAGTTAPTSPGARPPVDADRWVFVTEDLDVAWAYAWMATGHGRPKVLTVSPQGAVAPDPEHSPRMRAWRCEWATVTAVDLVPTMTHAEAVSGWSFGLDPKV